MKRESRRARAGTLRRLGLLLLAGALAACSLSTAPGEKLDASLREEVHRVPVAAADASIVVTSDRPRGAAPFPWIVLSHGTATTAEANRAIGRYRNLPLTREGVRRGYAVLLALLASFKLGRPGPQPPAPQPRPEPAPPASQRWPRLHP